MISMPHRVWDRMKLTIDVTPVKLAVLAVVTGAVAAGLGVAITWLAMRGPEAPAAGEQPVAVVESEVVEAEPVESADAGEVPEPVAVVESEVVEAEPVESADAGEVPEPVAVVESEVVEAEPVESADAGEVPEPVAVVESEVVEAEPVESADAGEVPEPVAVVESEVVEAEPVESADAGEVPEPVADSALPPPGPRPALVAASGYHTCAVDAAGGVACWGDNSRGLRLGDPSIGPTPTPVAVRGLGDVVAISIGDSSSGATDGPTCVLHGDRTVTCWGSDLNGALGRGTPPEGRSGDDPAAPAVGPSAGPAIPSKVPGISDAVALSVGGRFACVVHAGGEASCWGVNELGTLGDGTGASRDWPARVPGLSDVVAISAGWTHACAVHADGRVSCWGANSHGQLGNGSLWDHHTPTAVVGIGDAVAISTGSDFTCAVRRSGGLSCWGSNVSWYHDESGTFVDHIGKLGAGSVKGAESAPVPVLGIDDAVAVAAGTSSTCALHRDGGVSCWGGNITGEVGIGVSEPQMQPRRLEGISDALAITVSSRNSWAGSHACAVIATGDVFCWGDNRYGQLGVGDTENRLRPTRIPGYFT